MKKLFSLIAVLMFFITSLLAQDCLNDIHYTIVNQNAPGKAKNQFDRKCMPGNEGNARVWLMKANVYVRYYLYEQGLKAKDPSYKIKQPDIILEAVDAFAKAIQIDKNVQPMRNMLGAMEGQRECARDVEVLGDKYFDNEDYDKALEIYEIALRCYRIQTEDKKLNEVDIYRINYNLYVIYKIKQDLENYITYLTRAYESRENTAPVVYRDMYSYYLSVQDTVKCGEVVKKAKRMISDTLPAYYDIQLLELNYLYLTQEESTLKANALQMLQNHAIDEENEAKFVELMEYLINVDADKELGEFVDQYLEKYPNSASFTAFKADLYQKEAEKIEDERQEIRLSDRSNNEKIKLQEELIAKKEAVLLQAHDWYQKAYELNSDDIHTIRQLYKLKVMSHLPISEELQEKFNATLGGN